MQTSPCIIGKRNENAIGKFEKKKSREEKKKNSEELDHKAI